MMMECLELGGLEICWDNGRDEKLHLEQPLNPNARFYELDVPEIKWLPLTPYRGKCVKLMGTNCLDRKAAPLKVVYMRRDANARGESLRNGCGPEFVNDYYEIALQKHLHYLGESEEVDTLTVFDFDEVVKDPLKSFCALRNDGWPIDPVKAASGVNPELKHY